MKYTNAELHLHTAETSRCAHLSVRDAIPLYKDHGYDLVCVTDHFNWRYFPDEPLTDKQWKDECEKWFRGWYAAREEGEKYGLTVLHAAEFEFKDVGAEFLCYGFKDEDFLGNQMYRMDYATFMKFAHEKGCFVSIAHPFRREERPVPPLYDGAEIYNSHPSHLCEARNEDAAVFAKNYGLIPIIGQDFHFAEALKGLVTRFHGEVKDIDTLVAKLFAREYDMIVPNEFTINAKDF